jgi:RNA polymerase-binding transcription factor DksA
MHDPSTMTLQFLRQRLIRQRLQLLARYHDELARAGEELESVETEDVERATEQWDARVLSTLGDGDAHALQEIVAALRRFEAGTYGFCTVCEDAISAPRLDALPATPFCITCASARHQLAG